MTTQRMISSNLLSVNFSNPLVLASGILGVSAEYFKTLEQYKKSRQYYLKNGFHTTPYREENCIQPVKFNEVLNRINGVINVLNKYKCIWISDSVYKDFNYIRNFNKIIIAVSTLSWWAAVLSDAEEVYAPAKWKWYKRKRNKNLPHINLQGWRAVDL